MLTRPACWLLVVLGVLVYPAHAENETPALQPLSTAELALALRVPSSETVIYKGIVNNDSLSGAGQMMYPAPNAAGFIVAIITHGILLESTKNTEKEQQQTQADQVLLPYRPVLNSYQYRSLMQAGLAKMPANSNIRLAEVSEKPGSGWLIESSPVFFLTEDQSAIVLDHAVLIYRPDASEPAYQNTVRVVSKRKDAPTDIQGFWIANQGEKLKEESANLFAQSLELTLNDMSTELNAGNNPQKTVRYLQGRTEKMERGQVIRESCDRIVIKNLRGWIMSLPINPENPTSCTAG